MRKFTVPDDRETLEEAYRALVGFYLAFDGLPVLTEEPPALVAAMQDWIEADGWLRRVEIVERHPQGNAEAEFSALDGSCIVKVWPQDYDFDNPPQPEVLSVGDWITRIQAGRLSRRREPKATVPRQGSKPEPDR